MGDMADFVNNSEDDSFYKDWREDDWLDELGPIDYDDDYDDYDDYDWTLWRDDEDFPIY